MQSAAEQAPTHQGAPAGGLTSHPGSLRPTEIPEGPKLRKTVQAVVSPRTRFSKWKDLPTEAINPDSLAMDLASTEDIIDLMVTEDRKVISAVRKEKVHIARGADLITEALRRGGRIIFVGAGTSGRLGVLEAAEMRPTFSTPERLVQAIVAGGKSAFFHPKEGVEDNFEEGSRALARVRPTKKCADWSLGKRK